MDNEATEERAVSLRPGERISARLLCNHIRNGRTYDGDLDVTTQRLVYIEQARRIPGVLPQPD